MAGELRYTPPYDSPSLMTDLLGVRLTIPAKLQDISGCTPFTNNHTDGGQPLAGSVLLLLGGSCSGATQFKNAQDVGAVAWINTFRSEGPDLYSSWASNNPSASGPQTAPYVIISYHDGLVIANWLRANPATPLLMDMDGAGTIHPDDMAVLQAITRKVNDTVPGGYTGDCTQVSCGNTRALIDVLVNPQIDPCQHRAGAIWCVNGRIVGFIWKSGSYLKNLPANTFDLDLLAQLPNLVLINFGTSLMSSLGNGLCKMHSLAVVAIYSQDLLTVPNCFHLMPNISFIHIGSNKLTSFPTSLFNGSCPRLGVAKMAVNNFGLVPTGLINAVHSPNLSFLICNSIGMIGTLPDLRGMVWMQQVLLNGNTLSADPNVAPAIQATYLDGLPLLYEVNIASTGLAIPLPTFVGAIHLQTLSLSFNGFYGPVPDSWRLTSLVTLNARNNAITSPINPLGGINTLTSVDLSWNQLTNHIDLTPTLSTFDTWLLTSVSPTVLKLSLAHNNLTGDWSDAKVAPKLLQIVDLSYNKIAQFGSALFALAGLQQLDYSNNALVGTFPSTPPPTSLTVLNVLSNPQFHQPTGGAPLPTWLMTDTTRQVKAAGTSFVCAAIVGKSSSILASLDPSFSAFQFCACDSSYFGLAPNCVSIPDSAVVGQDTFLAFNRTLAESMGVWTSTASSQLDSTIDPLLLDSASLVSFAGKSSLHLTDAVYGSARLATGLNTRWLLSSSEIVQHTAARVIVCVLYLSRAFFTGAENLVTVTSGDLTVNRQFDFAIRGDETARLDAAMAKAVSLGATRFGVANTAIFTLQVFDTDAVVQFQSRDTGNQHFQLDYFFSDACPVGYQVNDAFVAGSESDATSATCTLLPLCSAQLLRWTIGACDEEKLERTVSYAFAGHCRPSSTYSLPADESTSCEIAPAGHSTSIVLLVLVSMVCVGLVALAVVMVLSNGTPRQLLTARLMNEYVYVSLVGCLLLLSIYFPSLGEVTTFKCQIRTHLLVAGFSLVASGVAVSLYRRRQQLTLPLFNPNSPALQLKLRALIASVVLVNVALVLIGQFVAHSDGESLHTVTWSLDGGGVLPVTVCALPSLWLSVVLLVGNMAWLLPTVLLGVQVLWLATLNRDRMCAQLATAKQRSSGGGKTKQQQLRRHTAVAKSAMLTLVQLQSMVVALCGGLLLLAIFILVTFVWTTTSPAVMSMAQGTVVLLMVAAMTLPLFAFSLAHRCGLARMGGSSSATSSSVEMAAIATTGKKNKNKAKKDSAAAGDEEDGTQQDADADEDRDSHEDSRSTSTSTSYNSSTTYNNGGSQYRPRDAWAQLTANSNLNSGGGAMGLFDANNTTGSKSDTVVSLTSDPVAMLHLRKFAEASFQADSINFIVAVQQFIRRRLHPTESEAGANSYAMLLHETDALFDQYVRANAPDQINIADGQRESVRVALAALHSAAASLLSGRTAEADLKSSEKDILSSPSGSPAAATNLRHISIPRDSPTPPPDAVDSAPTIIDPTGSPSSATSLPGTVSPVNDWMPASSPISAMTRGGGSALGVPMWSPSSQGRRAVDPLASLARAEWVEALSLSLGVSESALWSPAPPQLCQRAVELWRECSLEMVLLISQNTLPAFQDSEQARLANTQLAFCDGFENFNAAEQRAILARINIQFGQQEVRPNQQDDHTLFVQVVKP